MSTENELIRAAFGTIADEAADGARIRAVLTRRSRTARQRRVVLQLAGVGGVAVVVGGVSLGVRDVLDRQPATPVAAVPGGPGGGWLTVPWQFRPGWLPGGFGETSYGMTVVGSAVTMASRTWEHGDTSVSVTVGWGDGALDLPGPKTSTTVNGFHADLYQDQFNAYITWQRPGQPVLTVSAGNSANPDPAARRNQALRVAENLRPDAGHGYVGPRPGYLPTNYEKLPWLYMVRYDTVRDDGPEWRQDIVLNGYGHGMAQYSVTIGPNMLATMVDRSSATPATVRGLPGWTIPTQNQVLVTLPDGREIWALGGLNDDAPQVLRMVNELDLGPVPDMTWVGSR